MEAIKIDRKLLIATAKRMKLKFAGNISTVKLVELVEAAVAKLDIADLITAPKKEKKTYCGISPITGEKVYK